MTSLEHDRFAHLAEEGRRLRRELEGFRRASDAARRVLARRLPPGASYLHLSPEERAGDRFARNGVESIRAASRVEAEAATALGEIEEELWSHGRAP